MSNEEREDLKDLGLDPNSLPRSPQLKQVRVQFTIFELVEHSDAILLPWTEACSLSFRLSNPLAILNNFFKDGDNCGRSL